MCGIFAICHASDCQKKFDIDTAQKLSLKQNHRGPDFRGAYQHPVSGNILCHERLAIIDLNCKHPIQGKKKDHQVVHNGEIYNHQKLEETYFPNTKFQTTCDSEIIIYLYEKFRHKKIELCNLLRGIFGVALIYEDDFFVARDPIGIKPVYYGRDQFGNRFFSSEMKVIESLCGSIELHQFPPGYYFTPKEGFVQYYMPDWFNYELAVKPALLDLIKNALIESTHKRLMSDAPIGVLLSGGLDSSLISSIATRKMREQNRPVSSFSIGIDHTSPDILAAREIAKFLSTKHYEINFTIEEGISIIKKLVYHLESYDVTTIRASTPMYILSKKIHELGIKTVLSGEGADEVFGGYLYFHNAPNNEEFQKELIRRVKLLSTADCLRADKSCMANSLETRVPFLDRDFLDVVMLTAPEFKRPRQENNSGKNIEKWILRKAFDDKENPYLPPEILWRQKEQFSDGVGYDWIDKLIAHCTAQVSDAEFEKAAQKFPYNTPETKEAYYIRKIFHEHFPSKYAAETVVPWIPVWQDNKDPSGRANKIHDRSTENTTEKVISNFKDVQNGISHYG